MEATVKAEVKRKNIDLPVDILQKLSVMAATHSKSLKAYIESILIDKANSVSVEVTENPSPSGDTWWNDPRNVAEVKEGLADIEAGRVEKFSMDEIKKMLGL